MASSVVSIQQVSHCNREVWDSELWVGAEERDSSLRFLELANIHKYFGKRPRTFEMVTEKEVLSVNSFQCDGPVQPPMAPALFLRIGQAAS